jgi:hypothetical protein
MEDWAEQVERALESLRCGCVTMREEGEMQGIVVSAMGDQPTGRSIAARWWFAVAGAAHDRMRLSPLRG